MNIRKTLRILVLAGIGAALAGAAALVAAYFYFAAALPKVDTLADYRPPVVTTLHADDGSVIAELSRERRILVPVARMPRRLIEAFVAAEDANFFHHRGIDLMSIARAAVKNVMAGGIRQGGSTITQQVAKSLLLSPEKKFSRKFKEAILAWRMEQKLSKEDILFLYLNQIYLGHGAYGVQAAAENYFGKNVDDLTLAECALLGGLPQAPSRYSPYRNLPLARDRQAYVLSRMVKEQFITPQEAEAARQEPVTIQPRASREIAGSAYFTEQVRRYLEQTYGEERIYTDGLRVYTTMNVAMQQAAQEAVQENLRRHDKRQGYRGPLRALSAEQQAAFLEEQSGRLDQPPQPGTLLQGVLTGKKGASLLVRIGPFTGTIALADTRWAGRIEVVDQGRPARVEAGRPIRLPIGSVLQVRVLKQQKDKLLLALEQDPRAQGALIALEPRTGRVKALVGGYDFRASQFNRAIQARRQPGSAFKPIIYAAALDKGYTPATIMLDTPLIYRETGEDGEQREWKPKNYKNRFTGVTTMRQALARSYNVVTVKMLQDIGVRYAAGYARKLGIESPLTRDLTLALGSSAVSPMEMATAFCVFANGGVRFRPVYITRVLDRDGQVLESVDPADFPAGPGPGQRLVRQSPERVISPETAYLITNMMESVVQEGTGFRARALKRAVAGKTGTTNDQRDAWFVGYAPQLLALAWTGYDQERPLGKQETGSRAAAPAWVAFMQQALKDLPAEEFPVPDGIEFRPVDPATGLLVPEDAPDLSIEAFAPGTAPTQYALDVQQPRAIDFFQMDLEAN
jgi:penicillin-binding protein 1A